MATPPTSTKPRILTGDTPTSTGLHLGHYVGSLENRLALQDQYDCYFLIANVHAFTTLAERTEEVRANTIGIVKDWLAVGLDPERSTFVIQSEIPAIAELTFLLAMLIPFKKVMRNPTIKSELADKFGMELGELFSRDESSGGGKEGPSFGFPLYAVGQCADILAFRPDLVPVGEDQEAHIEMCRDVALKFNQLYAGVGNRIPPEQHVAAGGVFPIPKAKVGRIARLVGIDGEKKMSKSLGNAIFLYDDAKTVQKKINRITTGRQSPTEPGNPDNVLMQYVDAFIGGGRAEELRRRYGAGDNIGDGHIKQELGEAINTLLNPMRERRAKLDGPQGDALVQDVIRRGVARANVVAVETLALAKRAMKLDFGAREVIRP